MFARRRLWAMWVTVGVFAAACTGSDGSAGTETPSVAPFTVAEKPLWVSSTDLLSANARVPQFRGDALLVWGSGKEQGEQDRMLVVVDVATGKARWRLDSGDLTGAGHERVLTSDATGQGDAWTMIAPYDPCDTRPGCVADNDPAEQAYGVIALSGVDGRVRWRTPIDNQQPVERLSVGEDVAISRAGGRVVAINVSDGSVMWESAGMWPVFVGSDTVLGVQADRLDFDPKVQNESTVVGLDAKTGAEKWDLSDRYPRSKMYLALGDVAVIGTADERGANQRSRVIDVNTGREIADLGAPKRCLSDDESLIICWTKAGDETTIFDVDTREKAVLPEAISRDGIGHAWHGYLFTGDDTFDRDGTVVSDDSRGLVVAMSDQYLVTFPDLPLDKDKSGDSEKFAVYRIERK